MFKLGSFKVGDDSKVRFWYNLWCRDMTLKKPFQIYLVLLEQMMLLLRLHVDLSRYSTQKNVSFDTRDWAVDVFALFFRAECNGKV